jgi:transposase
VQFPVQYGRNLKALMVYLCIYQLVPYDRVRETFSDIFGRSLSTGTLVNAVQDCHRNLAGVEEQIRELLTGAQVLNIDDTGMRVTGIRQWLHVASTDVLTWYGHHRKRGNLATDDMLILP